jgi:argininosuccinate synthase
MFQAGAIYEGQYFLGTSIARPLIRLKLYKGNTIVAGRKSPKSLYDPQIATMEAGASTYDQGDAAGFIRLNALRQTYDA